VLEYLDEIQSHYDSLWGAARVKIHNWGPAANSKALHQIIPGLFVMWDVSIVPFAHDHADFMAEMHRLALRLIADGPYTDQDELELRMQDHLGDGVRKTLAKYLDDFNWYEMVGAERHAPHLRTDDAPAIDQASADAEPGGPPVRGVL
jgi:hypothetical protein